MIAKVKKDESIEILGLTRFQKLVFATRLRRNSMAMTSASFRVQPDAVFPLLFNVFGEPGLLLLFLGLLLGFGRFLECRIDFSGRN